MPFHAHEHTILHFAFHLFQILSNVLELDLQVHDSLVELCVLRLHFLKLILLLPDTLQTAQHNRMLDATGLRRIQYTGCV